MADTQITCRYCQGTLGETLVDLGDAPPSNGFLRAEDLAKPEARYPLRVMVCDGCRLAQLDHTVPPGEIFQDYAYFSSYSSSWVEHARRFSEAAIDRFGLTGRSHVVEIASNDGYLLRHMQARGIPCLGIEPAENVAAAARDQGIETLVRFFDSALAEDLVAQGKTADLLIANNVFAHVPDIGDFSAALAGLLAPEGVLVLEFPHLLRLMDGLQFDTIYHEHYFYFSLLASERVLAAQGLQVFDLEELPTHGGSLRLYLRKGDAQPSDAVLAVRNAERAAGLDGGHAYRAFGARVAQQIAAIRQFLETAKREGRSVAAYGAAAKGNTLLNACAVGPGLLDFVVDRNPYKQGRFTPGSRVPVRAPEALAEAKPDFVLILPWNLRDEIVAEMAQVRDWGGRFVIPIPRVEILD